MSEEDISNDDQVEEFSLKVPEFKSPFVNSMLGKAILPLLISYNEVSFREIESKIEEKSKAIAIKLRGELTEDEREQLIEERKELEQFTVILDKTFEGHFSNETHGKVFDNSDPGDWVQYLEDNDGKRLGVFQPAVKPQIGEDGYVTGVNNINALFSKDVGVGAPAKATLPASMITVRIGNITEKSILRLMIELNEAKNELGFNTKGIMYSAADSKLVCIVTEFCLRHVITSTLRETTFENLVEVFDVTDAQILASAALKSLYPDGYPFTHVCINEDCSYKIHEDTSLSKGEVHKLDYGRVNHYNSKKFDQYRFRFLGASWGTHTVEQVLKAQDRYRKDLEVGPFNGADAAKVKMVIRTPRFKEYRDISYTWLADIQSFVNDSMSEATYNNTSQSLNRKRIENINSAMNALYLQRDAAWIKEVHKITTDGEVIKVKGIKGVMTALEALSSNEEIKINASRILLKGKNQLLTSMTGIPMFKCPKCQTLNDNQNDVNLPTSIRPRNVIADFFYITESKHQV